MDICIYEFEGGYVLGIDQKCFCISSQLTPKYVSAIRSGVEIVIYLSSSKVVLENCH